MSRVAEAMPRHPFSESNYHGSRHLPILPSSTSAATFSQSEMMDMTPPASSTAMGPPSHSSPEMEHDTTHGPAGEPTSATNGSMGTVNAAAAAAAAQQPKVVQTAFIHKLYNMLEDSNIQNLISWSSNNESFVMCPSTEFSKVLSQYFKHTNISSFVRQLNMYGFHKVSDVFHTGAPDSTLWEFKHGNGNFKRGDIAGLREIKRRASRHALIHRDSFSSPQHKPSVSQPGTPAEPVAETGEQRLSNMEQSLYDLHARLMRTEESNTALSAKCAMLHDNLARCHQWNNELSHLVMKMVPDQESPLYRDLAAYQRDVSKHTELMRLEEPHESLMSGRPPFFSSSALEAASLSHRQPAHHEHRFSGQHGAPRPNFFRPPVPPHLAISPRRFGSIGGPGSSPSHGRPSYAHQSPLPPTQQHQQQHPLASVSEPGMPGGLGRRHTSADIRSTDGWPPHNGSPFDSTAPSFAPLGAAPPSHAPTSHHPHPNHNWPSSPRRTPSAADQHVRDVLASYQIGGSSRSQSTYEASRGLTPPAAPDHHQLSAGVGSINANPSSASNNSNSNSNTTTTENGWSHGSAPKFQPRLMDSAPQTRRSSMASNVHSLLNPAETAERREEEDEASPSEGGGEERKRKRIQ